MTKKWLTLFVIGCIVVFLQLLFIHSIGFYGLINPKIYPIFLLLLPRNIKPVYLMMVGLFLGALIDFLCNTQGIGMSTSVLICFLKPYIIRLMYNKSEDEEVKLSTDIQGTMFIVSYLMIGLLIFHIFYFFIELGEIDNIVYLLIKSILSSITAFALYAVFHLIFISVPKKK